MKPSLFLNLSLPSAHGFKFNVMKGQINSKGAATQIVIIQDSPMAYDFGIMTCPETRALGALIPQIIDT